MAKLLIVSSFIILTFTHSLFAQAKWTFMVYLDADNNLEEYGIQDFNEMEEIGSTDDVHIIVQMDRIPGEDNSNGDWTDTRRYRIIKDSNSYSITSPLLENLGEVNMGDPNSLIEFVNWARTNYPAQHYCLVLWDHGDGWRKVNAASMTALKENRRTDQNYLHTDRNTSAMDKLIEFGKNRSRSICHDDTDGDYLSNDEIAQALAAVGIKIDIVGYDACLMAMFECAYEIRDYADFLVGSEEEEPSEGWPYNLLLEPLVNNPLITPLEFAQVIVDKYGEFYNGNFGSDQTQSAFDLSSVNETLTAINNFAQAIIDDNESWIAVRDAKAATDNYAQFEHIDLYDFTDNLQVMAENDTIKDTAADLKTALSSFVIRNYTEYSHENAYGVAIYFPHETMYSAAYTSPYTAIDFPVDSQWDEFLHAYYDNNEFGGTNDDAYEPNDTFEEAYGPIEFNTDYEGYLEDSYDVDIFKLEVVNNFDSMKVQLSVPTDFDLYFYDDAGTLLDYSEKSGPQTEILVFQRLLLGTYYIKIMPWFVSPDEYTLTVLQYQHQTGVTDLENNYSKTFKLFQNYPNPCNSSTIVTYYLPKPNEIRIDVYSVSGQEVQTLYSGLKDAGEHRVVWNGKNMHGNIVSSGIYYYTLTANDAMRITKKLLFIK